MTPCARSRTSAILKLPAIPIGISPLRILMTVDVVVLNELSSGPIIPVESLKATVKQAGKEFKYEMPQAKVITVPMTLSNDKKLFPLK